MNITDHDTMTASPYIPMFQVKEKSVIFDVAVLSEPLLLFGFLVSFLPDELFIVPSAFNYVQ